MGAATTNGYFYKPSLGASGATELAIYDAALDATDTVIANLVLGTGITDGSITEAKLSITNAPTSNYYLKWNGTTLEWAAVSTPASTSISDTDGDTKVQTEESSDEDKVRIDCGSVANVAIFAGDVTADILDMTVAVTSGIAVSLVLDALTTGTGLHVLSASTETNARDLVKFYNDATQAVGTTVLNVRQDAAKNALLIDMNANEIALYIDTETTSSYGIQVESNTITTGWGIYLDGADALTDGGLVYLESNGANASARILLSLINEHSSAVGTSCITVRNDGGGATTAAALVIDANLAAATSFYIDSEATTGHGIHAVLDALTTGSGMLLTCASTQTNARSLLEVTSSAAAATGTTVVDITNASTGLALNVTSAATTTTGAQFTFDALTTGYGVLIEANSANTGGFDLLRLYQENASAVNATALYILTAAGQGIYIDHNTTADESALYIDSEVTNTAAVTIAAQNETSYALSVFSNGLTSGAICYFATTVATATGDIVQIHSTHANATADLIDLNQDGNAKVLDIDSEATTASCIYMLASLTTGWGMYMNLGTLTDGGAIYATSNSTDVSARNLVEVINLNAAAVGTVILHLDNNATSGTAMVVDCDGSDASLAVIGINIDVDNANTGDQIALDIDQVDEAKSYFARFNATSAWTSTIDPSATAETGWIKIDVGGTPMFIPYYAAS